MALQSIIGGMIIPDGIMGVYGAPQFGNLLLDAATEKVGFVFRVPKTGTIAKLGFVTRTVTVGDTLKIGIYTVDATTGFPTATAYGGMVAGTQIVANADDNVGFTVALGTNATATKGDTVAIVIEFNSFVAGNLNIGSVTGTGLAQSISFPYAVHNTAGSWADVTNIPTFWVQYDDGTYAYIPGSFPVTAITANTVASNTAGADEYAVYFQMPVICRCSGFALYSDFAQNFTVNLYQSDGSTTAASITYDGNVIGNTTSRWSKQEFDSPFTLTANTVYRISMAPQTTTGIMIYTITAPTTAAWNQMEGGSNFYLSTRVDLGAWSQTADRRALISPMFDQFDGGGGGGLKVHPGMSGGLQG